MDNVVKLVQGKRQLETEIDQNQNLTLDEALELLATAIETYAVLTNSSLHKPQLEQVCEELAFLTALCQHLSKAQNSRA